MTPRKRPDDTTRPRPKRSVAVGSSAEAPSPKKKVKARGTAGQWSKACIACRRRKTKCPGGQPCEPCTKLKGIVCSYSSNEFATNYAGTALVEAFHMLRRKSPKERVEDFKYLKATFDATLIMSRLRLNTWTEYSNSASSQKDFESLELEDRHPFVYAPHHPLDLEKLDAATVRIVEWPGEGLQSILPEAVSQLAIYQFLFPSAADPPPTSTPQFDDQRLRGPFLKPWTSVEIGDGLASRALQYHLNTDHPLYGPFHAEPFIRDLVSQGYTYCSSLLVNSLMYWACQNYAAVDPSAQSMVGPFCAEAEIGWEIERSLPTRLTMAAGVFLSLGHLAQGKMDAVHYLKEALSIGSEMGLYKGGSYEIIEGQWAPEEANAASQAAWGVFNVAMMMSTFYFQFNIDYPCSLPCLGIPRDPRKIGQDPPSPAREDSTGDSPEDSPTDPLETPEWYSAVFDTTCQFWTIMHEVAVAYGQDPVARASKPPSMMLAEYKFRELLAFGDKLRNELMCQKNSPPCVSLFHIWYHCAILSIFRPFLIPGKKAGHELRTFSTRGATPESVATASVSQLKRLILDYRLRHESVACSFNWHTGILYLLFALMNEQPGDNSDFYFRLCLYGYKKLANFPVVEQIVGSFVSLMVLHGHMVGDESRNKFNEVWKGIQNRCSEAKERTSPGSGLLMDSEESMLSVIHAPFMVDLHLAMTKPEEATAEYMAVSCEINFLTAD